MESDDEKAIKKPTSNLEKVTSNEVQRNMSGDEGSGNEEDEEERLILNGGAGIPIGPVSHFISFFHIVKLKKLFYKLRMVNPDRFCLLLRLLTKVVNVWY